MASDTVKGLLAALVGAVILGAMGLAVHLTDAFWMWLYHVGLR